MDESLKCECGNEHFWYLWEYVRCPHCFNEYKQTIKHFNTDGDNVYVYKENLLRRFNKEENNYSNWEKSE